MVSCAGLTASGALSTAGGPMMLKLVVLVLEVVPVACGDLAAQAVVGMWLIVGICESGSQSAVSGTP